MNTEETFRELYFQPNKPDQYDVELFTAQEMINRSSDKNLSRAYRYRCEMLVLVSEGECTQWLDSKPIHAQKNTLILVRSGQTHQFSTERHWNGMMLLFRSEVLPPDQHSLNFNRLPDVLYLNETESLALHQQMQQMQSDSQTKNSATIFQLLRYQLYALIARLTHIATNLPKNRSNLRLYQRFYAFQELLEQHFQHAHQVQFYADKLTCSEKSLNRACQAARQSNAKTLIEQRRILEAKRLLRHSELSTAAIADQLGFTDPTHFGKTFKKATGLTPAVFRENAQPNAK